MPPKPSAAATIRSTSYSVRWNVKSSPSHDRPRCTRVAVERHAGRSGIHELVVLRTAPAELHVRVSEHEDATRQRPDAQLVGRFAARARSCRRRSTSNRGRRRPRRPPRARVAGRATRSPRPKSGGRGPAGWPRPPDDRAEARATSARRCRGCRSSARRSRAARTTSLAGTARSRRDRRRGRRSSRPSTSHRPAPPRAPAGLRGCRTAPRACSGSFVACGFMCMSGERPTHRRFSACTASRAGAAAFAASPRSVSAPSTFSRRTCAGTASRSGSRRGTSPRTTLISWTRSTQLELERVDVVGHSFGGRLALELAARRPERVGRIVLLDPAVWVPPQIALDRAEWTRQDESYSVAGRGDRGEGRCESTREARARR